jgi:hypothetical protein
MLYPDNYQLPGYREDPYSAAAADWHKLAEGGLGFVPDDVLAHGPGLAAGQLYVGSPDSYGLSADPTPVRAGEDAGGTDRFDPSVFCQEYFPFVTSEGAQQHRPTPREVYTAIRQLNIAELKDGLAYVREIVAEYEGRGEAPAYMGSVRCCCKTV